MALAFRQPSIDIFAMCLIICHNQFMVNKILILLRWISQR